jgi:RNA polymerase sigma-70 factor, ECF subfamily
MEVAGLRARFEREVMPHLDAAHNFAFWILRDRADADDATQDAILRAFRFFGGFQGGNAKAWLLKIVRNACYSLYTAKAKGQPLNLGGDDKLDPEHELALSVMSEPMPDPEAQLLAKLDAERLMAALQDLPPTYREALVLREIEELSYKEIAQVAGVPIGTVMSRLARGRGQLALRLAGLLAEEK